MFPTKGTAEFAETAESVVPSAFSADYYITKSTATENELLTSGIFSPQRGRLLVAGCGSVRLGYRKKHAHRRCRLYSADTWSQYWLEFHSGMIYNRSIKDGPYGA